jgi:hypothetical protein
MNANLKHRALEAVRQYYGEVLTSRNDLKTGACCTTDSSPEWLRSLIAEAGCADARVVSSAPVPLIDADIERRIGFVNFRSLTIRGFKLPLEDRCEDYGQIAAYRGTLPDHPHAFELDDHHRFESGKPMRVCGNTADMLTATRYRPHFEVMGDKSRHFGLFDCAPGNNAAGGAAAAACC